MMYILLFFLEYIAINWALWTLQQVQLVAMLMLLIALLVPRYSMYSSTQEKSRYHTDLQMICH